jgi:hypothetical protein
MKTVLRKISNGLYFAGPGEWTQNPSVAKNFNSIDRIVEFIQRWRLKDVEVAFAFERAGKITVVPGTRLDVRHSRD